ncbi:MAG: hypothetical protein HC877_22120 [Thioploca sp.]|nr:hypothetical protein [Thioploca sp.]
MKIQVLVSAIKSYLEGDAEGTRWNRLLKMDKDLASRVDSDGQSVELDVQKQSELLGSEFLHVFQDRYLLPKDPVLLTLFVPNIPYEMREAAAGMLKKASDAYVHPFRRKTMFSVFERQAPAQESDKIDVRDCVTVRHNIQDLIVEPAIIPLAELVRLAESDRECAIASDGLKHIRDLLARYINNTIAE